MFHLDLCRIPFDFDVKRAIVRVSICGLAEGSDWKQREIRFAVLYNSHEDHRMVSDVFEDLHNDYGCLILGNVYKNKWSFEIETSKITVEEVRDILIKEKMNLK